jgi:hypothetical protein
MFLFPFCEPGHGPIYFLLFSSELIQRATPSDRWSQWPRGLKRRSADARLLRLWIRIPPGAWMSVSCECCVLSGRRLCDELISRPEKSYRLWYVNVCDLKNLVNEAVVVPLRAVAPKRNKQTHSDQHAGHMVPNQYNYFRMLRYFGIYKF